MAVLAEQDEIHAPCIHTYGFYRFSGSRRLAETCQNLMPKPQQIPIAAPIHLYDIILKPMNFRHLNSVLGIFPQNDTTASRSQIDCYRCHFSVIYQSQIKGISSSS